MRRVSHIEDAPHGFRHVLSFLICLLVLKSYLCQVMNRYSDLLSRCLRWLLRFRHRCGYGIHSPFAFGFVTGVIYENGQYYAYAPLHRCFQEQKAADGLRECDLRLLFRVANASGASSVWLSSSGSPLVEQYVRAALVRAQVYNMSGADHGTQNGGRPLEAHRREQPAQEGNTAFGTETLPAQADFFYADANGISSEFLEMAVRRAGPKAFFVLRGIGRNRAARRIWSRLKADARVRVTFNLYDFGIACFESRLNKEDYIVNYF